MARWVYNGCECRHCRLRALQALMDPDVGCPCKPCRSSRRSDDYENTIGLERVSESSDGFAHEVVLGRLKQ